MAVNNSLGPDSEADSGWYVGGSYGARGRQEKCLNFYPRPGVLLRLRVQRYTRNNISTCKRQSTLPYTSVHTYVYLEYMKYQDSRKRKICDFEFSSAENKRSIFRYSRSVPREERNFLHSYASYTLSKRNEITGAPTHSPGHFDAARNAFGVRVCARV